jgi:hypothetical protein
MQQQPFNPYSPPEARVDAWAQPVEADGDVAWRDGKDVVMLRDKPLPSRCVKCNAHVAGTVKPRKFYWHTPWLFLLIFVGILFYVIVALIARKKTEHAVALCPAHAKRRRNVIIGAFAAFFAGLLVAFSGSDYFGPGILLFVIAILIGLLGTRLLVPTKIDDRYVRFRGASPAFLDSLPVFPANRRR